MTGIISKITRLCAAGVLAWTLAGQTPPANGPSTTLQQRVAPPARITRFEAQPASIQPGQTATLIWATENPAGVTIDPDVGVVRPRGSRDLQPPATTTYTLTVRGPNNTVVTKTLTVTVAGTAARTAASAEAKKEVRRMPDGHPDLSGIYNSTTAAAGRGGRGGAPPANAPPPPVLKAGAEKFKVVRGPQDTGLYADCMPTGVPGAFFVPYQWELVQGVDHIVVLYEYPHLFRVIPTNLRAHQVDPDPTWMGDSIGRWEGDTLVVDTIAFNEKTELPGGFRHTESLHVVERFQRASPDSIHYEATVDDPNVFEKPWMIVRDFAARPDLDKVDEFVCENNRDYRGLFAK